MTLTRDWRSSAALLCAVLIALTAFVWGNQRHAQAATLADEILCEVDEQLGELPFDFDEECAGGEETPPPPPPVEENPECSDGIDNDSDGKTDWGVPGDTGRDGGCSTPTDDDESDDPAPPPPAAQCDDDIDNDGDALVDYPADPGCSGTNDNDESNQTGGGDLPPGEEVVQETNTTEGSSRSRGGGSRRSGGSQGEVLGAATECVEYLRSYIKFGGTNDTAEVLKLQVFLNDFESADLALTGTYDAATHAAVHAFQQKHQSKVLGPWGVSRSTGYVYYTTRKTINEIYCQSLKDFPLSGQQEAEIERVKTQGARGPVGRAAPVVVSAKAIADDVDLGSMQKPGIQSAAVANASTTPKAKGGNWFANFWGWITGR